MSKAFDYTKEIVVARTSNTNIPIDKKSGELVAEFFEAIYNKLVELDDQTDQSKD